MSIDTVRPDRPRPPATAPAGAARKRPWRWQHYMSCVALVFLFWEAWTIIAWLSDDPHAITQHRDPSSSAYTIAKAYEVGAIIVALALGTVVVRKCIRERRVTFDAQFCIAAGLAFWMDTFYNFTVQTNAYSSNFVNIGNWCSHAPFVLNKACGESPEPIILLGIIYVFGLLGCAMVGGVILTALGRRFPALSTAKKLGVCMVLMSFVDLFGDFAATRLGLWNLFVSDSFTIWGSQHRCPILILIPAGCFFGGPVVMRHFKNDKGQTVFERGLEHLSSRTRLTVTFLSLVGTMQVLIFIVTTFLVGGMGLFAKNTPDYPAHIVNGMCDVGTIQGTAYGPCPGTPGYTAPLRWLPNAPAGQ